MVWEELFIILRINQFCKESTLKFSHVKRKESYKGKKEIQAVFKCEMYNCSIERAFRDKR